MSRFFINRPIFASVISIVILIAGFASFGGLPVSRNPEISPPTVQVTANYPGANAQVVAATVAAPIEEEVNGVEDMIYMSSTSASDGSYTLTVTFKIGTDMDMATVLVQNRVAIANPKLPEEVRRQGVTTRKQSTQILQFLTLSSPGGEIKSLELSNRALDVKDELSRIEGVGFVRVFGAGDYAMRIWLNPQKMKSRNLTTQDVVAAIGEQNVQVAAGQVGGPPAPEGTAFQYTINALGRLKEAEQFGNIIIKTGEGGRITRVKDVAKAERGAKEYTYDSTFNGKPCATIAVYQLPGANAMSVAERVRGKMDELARQFPKGLRHDIPFDTTRFVKASIEEVYETIFIAVTLVIVVIFVFLQNWRATIVPCAAIPVSLIGTFAVMAALGFSINMLSLFGVVLAIGIVVDDAIVVVENTSRHLDAGLESKQAAIKAMDEITGPVIATTLVLLAVFVPTAFMGGITGQLYRQFALTISAAVLISTINALTLSPALCGILLRPSGEKRFIFFRWFNAGFDRATDGYTFLIRWTVRLIVIVMLVFGGLVFLTGWGFKSLPTGFVPEEDQGYVFVDVQLPDAGSMQRTQEVSQKLDKIFENTPGVADWVSITGYSMLSGTAGSNLAMVAVIFEPWEERTEPHLSQQGILARLRGEFAGVQEAIVFAFVPPAIDGLGAAGGFQMEVQDVGGTMGVMELQRVAEEMVANGNAQSGLTALNTTFRANVPQLFADVDRTKVKTLNVPLSSVFQTLQAFLGAAYVNDFNLFGRTYQVRVQADSEFRVSADDIRRLDVRNDAGDMVPIGTFVNVEETFGPPVIRRYMMYSAASINGSAAPGYSSGQALALMEQMADAKQVNYQWTGMSYQEKETGGGGLIFLLAAVFVFLVLAAQYESWTSPAAVIAVVPLAALGVVIALVVRGMDNNTYTQIGVVLLVALASKNAILIVEFAREKRQGGLSIGESAVAASRLRFRAILMTAFSSILGFMPLLVASGAGAGSRQAVGTAVVGGMIAATIFSVLFVPSFFVVFQGLGELGGKLKKKPSPEPDSSGGEAAGESPPESPTRPTG
ncbi:MAG: efflux RND transporter permease subunit [Planctomycetota bacterium]|jgi:HAE1 family hydrophobic/amphiphilic exporter-1